MDRQRLFRLIEKEVRDQTRSTTADEVDRWIRDSREGERLDRCAPEGAFPSRSRTIQETVEEKLDRVERTRLAQECSRLDPEFEELLAEEGMPEEHAEWPQF